MRKSKVEELFSLINSIEDKDLRDDVRRIVSYYLFGFLFFLNINVERAYQELENAINFVRGILKEEVL